jgi:hypothetical protein
LRTAARIRQPAPSGHRTARGLLSHTEEIDIARPLAVVIQAGNRPLQEGIRPTTNRPGVSGTFRLTKEAYGSVGSRKLVCLDDGSMAVEEVLHSDNRRFSTWCGTTSAKSFAPSTMRSASSSIRKLRRTGPGRSSD